MSGLGGADLAEGRGAREPLVPDRAWKTLQRLGRHDISRWALAGGLAVELHCSRDDGPPSTRPLNDIDFVTASFDGIPATLGADFVFRHVHPLDPPGKTILQLVDADAVLRVDVFRAYGATMSRTRPLDFPFGPMRIISREDVLARTARLLLDLRSGVPVAAKHAKDYPRLEKLMAVSDVEAAWQDHRRPGHPATFREANALVQDLIAAHPDLLIIPDYSKDAAQVCSRCMATAEFPLADSHLVQSLLGYC